MQKLLSLPPNLIHCFHELEEVNHTDWFCTSDPIGSKLGSGGGTTWLLQACHQAFAPQESFSNWIGDEKRILLQADKAVACPATDLPAKYWLRSRSSVGKEDKNSDRIYYHCSSRSMKGLWIRLRPVWIRWSQAEMYISVRKSHSRIFRMQT